MKFKEIKQKYEKILEETNKALIESDLIIKQEEKEQEDIQKKAQENLLKLSRLL